MSDLNIYITTTNGLISIAKLVRCVHSQMLSVEFVDFSLQSSLDQCPRTVSLKWHWDLLILLLSLQQCIILSDFLYIGVNANPFCCSWLCQSILFVVKSAGNLELPFYREILHMSLQRKWPHKGPNPRLLVQ